MKAIGAIRPLDNLGRVVIPKGMRTELNIKEGTKLAVNMVDGKLVIENFDCCTFCGSKDNLVGFKGKHICSECQNDLTKF